MMYQYAGTSCEALGGEHRSSEFSMKHSSRSVVVVLYFMSVASVPT